MWKEELNIDVALENQEWKVYLDTQNSKNYDLSRSAWIGDLMAAGSLSQACGRPVTATTNTNWGNPKFDALIEQAARTGDPATRFGLLHDEQDLFLSELPVVMVYWYTNAYLLQPSVQNWNPLVLDNHNYKYIDLKADPNLAK